MTGGARIKINSRVVSDMIFSSGRDAYLTIEVLRKVPKYAASKIEIARPDEYNGVESGDHPIWKKVLVGAMR